MQPERPLVASVWKLPVFSGVLLAFAYFPFGWLVPNFVAFWPMLFWLDANPQVGVATRMRAGLYFGLTTHLTILHWMYAMLEISWLAIALYLFLVAMFALSLAASVTMAGWLRASTGWSYAVLLPLCWIPVEWAATWGDLRMTAHHLAHTLGPYPFLVQFADLLGPYGVGTFMLLVNALLYETVVGWRRGRARRPALVLAALLAATLGYDAWAWTHPPQPTDHLRVGLVQPNIPLEVKHASDSEQSQWQTLSRLTHDAAQRGAELVVWPESAHPRLFQHWLDHPETYTIPEIEALATATGTTILTGVEYARVRAREDYEYYNGAVVIHPDRGVDPRWTAKVYLVPFTEGIPFESVLGGLLSERTGELRWMSGGFSPGPRASTLPVDGHEVGVQVCYEELYWELGSGLRNAGADFQVIITNDAWFGRTVFQAYQANTVRLRAIESRSAYVRVANTGISGFVDPLGRYEGWTGLFVEAVEVHDVPVVSGRTIYNRSGDVVAWIALAGLPAAFLLAWTRRRRFGRSGAAEETT